MNYDPLQQAALILNQQALPGERLAYVNSKEEELLKKRGGAGEPINSSGVPSYFLDRIFGTDEEAPELEEFDVAGSAQEYVDAMSDPRLQDAMLGLRQAYDPQYQDLQFNLAQRAADQGNVMGRKQADMDIGFIQDYGQRLNQASRAADPLMQARTEQANRLADQAFEEAANTTLSPEQTRRATQSARESLVARGREMDDVGIAAEAMGREDYLRSILGENRQAAQQLGNYASRLNQATSVDPLRMAALQNQRALAIGMQPENVTRINPDAGVNLGLAEYSTKADYDAANYGARMDAKSGLMEGLLGVAAPMLPGAAGLFGKGLSALGGKVSGLGGQGSFASSLGGGLSSFGDATSSAFGG